MLMQPIEFNMKCDAKRRLKAKAFIKNVEIFMYVDVNVNVNVKA